MPSAAAPSSDIPDLLTAQLNRAIEHGASDVHLEPTANGYELRYRIDGILQTVDRANTDTGRALVGRLMVLAQLLTYRLDVPQEGRFAFDRGEGSPPLDLRLAIMPTTHGLRAAVRLPAELIQPGSLETLGMPPKVLSALHRFAQTDSGMLVLTGPAGSGKTTTIHALLRHIVQTQPGLSLIALEDPVERDLPGVTQIEVKPFGELTYERALRSILRQDPQVLMLGEIRDAATASLALQAALSGHRLICTLHAADPAGAISRLIEMGLEPYQITSALFGIIAQRLLRRRTGDAYRGRMPIAEFVGMDSAIRSAVLARSDADTLRNVYLRQPNYASMRTAAQMLVAQGLTDEAEVVRLLGPPAARTNG